MIKIAVLADLHLPDHSGTVKEYAFEWALSTAVEQQADVIVAAGDLTSVGGLAAASRVMQKLVATKIPFLVVPGNAELRTPETMDAVLKKLKTPVLFEHNGCHVLVLDNSTKRLTDEDRFHLENLVRQGAGQIFVAAHFSFNCLHHEDRNFIKKLVESGCIRVFVAGHEHIDSFEQIGDGELHLIRGIDPDKAIGGPPVLTFFEYESDLKKWRRIDALYPDGGVSSWSSEQRNEFTELLGISCMGDSVGGIDDAIRHRIRSIELRFESTATLPREELRIQIERWRNEGGQHLSIHFPDIAWDCDAGVVKGETEVNIACELALELGADILTMHVPRCPVGILTENTEVENHLLAAYAKSLEPVLIKGITVGIENLHMNPREEPGAERGFGYTPIECLNWINALRARVGSENVGFHFDIGHARNNAPYSSLYSISQWYADMGSLITGYHLHQVELNSDGRFINHRTVTGMFGPLISFSSLFSAWNRGQISHAPMYLEIRDNGALASLECFRDYLSI